MKGSRLILSGAIGIVIVSAAWGLSPRDPSGGPAGNPEHGLALYQRHCLRCHGEALDGKGPEAAGLAIPPVNFRSTRSRQKDDFELRLTIERGRALTVMHGWDASFTYKDVTDIIAYIRQVAPHLTHQS